MLATSREVNLYMNVGSMLSSNKYRIDMSLSCLKATYILS